MNIIPKCSIQYCDVEWGRTHIVTAESPCGPWRPSPVVMMDTQHSHLPTWPHSCPPVPSSACTLLPRWRGCTFKMWEGSNQPADSYFCVPVLCLAEIIQSVQPHWHSIAWCLSVLQPSRATVQINHRLFVHRLLLAVCVVSSFDSGC